MKIINYASAAGVVVLLKCPPIPLYITVWWLARAGHKGSVSRKTLKGGVAAFDRAVEDLHGQTD